MNKKGPPSELVSLSCKWDTWKAGAFEALPVSARRTLPRQEELYTFD